MENPEERQEIGETGAIQCTTIKEEKENGMGTIMIIKEGQPQIVLNSVSLNLKIPFASALGILLAIIL